MKTTEIIYKVVSSVNFKKNEPLAKREEILFDALVNAGISEDKIWCVGEKPSTGRCLGLTFLKDRVRIGYRCGYGRYNYAPCIEVLL